LLTALASIVAVDVHELNVAEYRVSVRDFVRRRWPAAGASRPPDLIIGAGRACQWPMLAARRACGGRAIYLMKPQWPACWFDLCLVPRHDRPRAHAKLLVTDGVLNDIQPARCNGHDGLILIGGPSAHFFWDDQRVLTQVRQVIARAPEKNWVISDSRRTPATTRAGLQQLVAANVVFVHAADCAADWIPQQLARSDTAWVSSDSVSMLYEALSAGIAVGVLEVRAKRADRINTIAADLERRGFVQRFEPWSSGAGLRSNTPLAEAARCAGIIVARFAGDRVNDAKQR
jgi:mitochondrial fission protein ELM1